MVDEVNQQSQQIWERKAAQWDEQMGDDGNLFHRTLIEPTSAELLNPKVNQRIVDAACGNGTFTRYLLRQGVQVTAFDFSAVFIERARARTLDQYREQVTYHQLDATDPLMLATLGEGAFDGVVCNMALMDMPEITTLYAAAWRWLRPGGVFVFTVMHPAFNHNGMTFTLEQVSTPDGLQLIKSLKLTGYRRSTIERGAGIKDEAETHFYFHRSLADLLNPAFAVGFTLDALREPTFPPNDEAILSWRAFGEFPPILGGRLHKA